MKDPISKFFSKVNKTDTCWLWTGWLSKGGYGYFDLEGKKKIAHKWYWEKIKGPYNRPMQLDHLCRVRNCVNPDHLELVTQVENIRRGTAGQITGAKNKAKTHCPKGHEYDINNTYKYKTSRRCNTCHRIAENKRQASKKLGETNA